MSVTRKAPTAAKKRDKPRRQRLAEVLAEREAELAEARRQNARLFDEVQAKTHDLEDALQEALRQQTATSDILRSHRFLAQRSPASVGQYRGDGLPPVQRL